MNGFLKSKGDYRGLVVYRKAECIYDLTFYFAKTYLSRGDRTVDQMIQAARSGKQNIIEGSSASLTSRETEIKLFNVAKASFDELLADYEDFIRVRNLQLWDSDKQKKVRDFCRTHIDSKLYRDIAPLRDSATLANLAITMIHQEIYLLLRLIAKAQDDFLKSGGIREQMGAARRSYRSSNGNNGRNGNSGRFGNDGRFVGDAIPTNPTAPKNPTKDD